MRARGSWLLLAVLLALACVEAMRPAPAVVSDSLDCESSQGEWSAWRWER